MKFLKKKSTIKYFLLRNLILISKYLGKRSNLKTFHCLVIAKNALCVKKNLNIHVIVYSGKTINLHVANALNRKLKINIQTKITKITQFY